MASHHVIIVDRANAAQLNAVHEAIKASKCAWWHHFENVWIVVGEQKGSEWKDIAKGANPTAKLGIVVLRISERPGGRWSATGLRNMDWFKKQFPPADGDPPS